MTPLQRMAKGAVITYSREGFRCAGRFVSETTVSEYLKNGWVYPTIRYGGSVTGRLLISALGKRAAWLRVEVT